MNSYSEDQLSKAVSRAKWLIEKKHVKSNIAYLIACKSFKLPPVTGRELVRKEYQKVKGIDPNQISLI